MKLEDAMRIIDSTPSKPKGFMIHCELKDGGLLITDYFPDKHKDEELIKTEVEAWDLAAKFAAKTYGKYVNIYVVDNNWQPVPGYEEKIIINREIKKEMSNDSN